MFLFNYVSIQYVPNYTITEDFSLLGCNAMSLGDRFPIFQSTVVLSSITRHCWALVRCSMYLIQILGLLVQAIRNITQPPFTGFVSPTLISCCPNRIYRITPSSVHKQVPEVHNTGNNVLLSVVLRCSSFSSGILRTSQFCSCTLGV